MSATQKDTVLEKNIPLFRLEDYLERIGYTGHPTPDLETLETIHLQHTATIPFENINPLLRWPVKLDIESLQQKIIRDKRGGYCFEQNLLLSHTLKEIGFDVHWLSARVLWNRAEGVVSPRTHMLLLIKIKGESFIADVGFGGLTLTSPLKLITGVAQSTPHGDFRIMQEGEEYILEANVRDEWKALYCFSLETQLLPDYEATSWYLCNHPQSHFIKLLRAARSEPGRRYALNNNEFAIHYVNGPTERITLSSAEEVMNKLEQVFLIQLPLGTELKQAIEAVIESNRNL